MKGKRVREEKKCGGGRRNVRIEIQGYRDRDGDIEIDEDFRLGSNRNRDRVVDELTSRDRE